MVREGGVKRDRRPQFCRKVKLRNKRFSLTAVVPFCYSVLNNYIQDAKVTLLVDYHQITRNLQEALVIQISNYSPEKECHVHAFNVLVAHS